MGDASRVDTWIYLSCLLIVWGMDSLQCTGALEGARTRHVSILGHVSACSSLQCTTALEVSHSLLFACLPSSIWSIRAFTSNFAFFDYINFFSKSLFFFLFSPRLLYTLHHIFYFTIHPVQIFLILLPFYIFSHTPSSSLSSHLNHNHN